MTTHDIVSREDWIKRRKEILTREKEITRLKDRLSVERRKLPWVKVDKNYIFDGVNGEVLLADLFEGRSQLVIYHFMGKAVGDTSPGWSDGCPTCSTVADHINASYIHLKNRDVTLMAVSRLPVENIEALKQRMGWRFNWVSSLANDFNRDFGVLATKEEVANGAAPYNYGTIKFEEYPAEDKHGLSVFYKNETGEIYHTYSTYGRGCEEMLGVYFYLDLVPKGRDEESLPFPMAWIRHHDRYEVAAR
jgi:predicted dithiol-disulfide oxidoreductase (DUF899 family)